jgi:hypothetical protein
MPAISNSEKAKIDKQNKVKKVVEPVPGQDKLQFDLTKKQPAEYKHKEIFESYNNKSTKDNYKDYFAQQKKQDAKNIKRGYKIKD